jgi:dephospho-CoA kinase
MMKAVGLTGGIGMGKSACANLLQQKGVPIIDTDDLARRIVEPGEPALKEIQGTFGKELVGNDGCLRRDALAAIVFKDAEARIKLEKILHPRIRELWKKQIDDWRAAGEKIGVVVIPLLFETKVESEFDAILCVACSAESQRQRLQARGLTLEQARQRIAAQMPIEEKMLRSQFVIWSEGSMEIHAEQVNHVLALLN